MDPARLEEILDNHGRDPSELLAILQDIQDHMNYLPEETLYKVADELELPVSRAYALATFFKMFSLEPRGKFVCDICMGTACYARGGEKLVDKLTRDLSVELGGTTEDGLFTVETVNCVGACALGPLVKIGQKYHGNMTAGKVDKMLKQYRKVAEE